MAKNRLNRASDFSDSEITSFLLGMGNQESFILRETSDGDFDVLDAPPPSIEAMAREIEMDCAFA